jgi:hypothetical protein
MPSAEHGIGYATARVHYAALRRGNMAGGSKRAAANDARDRICAKPVARIPYYPTKLTTNRRNLKSVISIGAQICPSIGVQF